ncbi:MAG: SDR family oxidoreductase [Acidobacteriaceae bacterium]
MSSYLVTGIAGFVGSSLAHALVLQGHQVRGIDNLSTGCMENIAEIRNDIDFRHIDLNDVEGVCQACKGVDYILHQAAMASVPRSIDDPMTSHRANIDGTFNLLLAARNAGVRRVVYAASSSAYGDQPVQPKTEDMLPNPLSPYAAQKLACEYYMQSFFNVYGLEAVSLRYFNIFGPRQSADSPYSGVIAKFIRSMLKGDAPTILGNGQQSRDFTYIENAVNANLLACTKESNRVAGKVFNIGTGKSYTLNQTYQVIASLLDFKKPPRYAEKRKGDIDHSQADIAHAIESLDYFPWVGFEEGMQQTVSWYCSQAADELDKLK